MPKNDFFLSPDDSQSMGDIEFMRKSKKVRKTFPKNASNQGAFEVVTDTASIKNKNSNTGNEQDQSSNRAFGSSNFSSQGQPGATGGSVVTQTSGNFKPQSSFTNASSNKSSKQRRRSDSSMDMFRNMARDMKKRR
ncbi:hypothetical protein [Myxosarcina sp. GI1]|uniref:hypothetical protein n=1 Tax=Myxosarcina sp. GI1 TaxID=1541065 RepID=UPI00068B5CE7|nr:hypothetical protein [Myxosarcina sp. GI1]